MRRGIFRTCLSFLTSTPSFSSAHTRNGASGVTTNESTAESFKSVPGPKGLPILGTLLDYSRKDGLRFNKMFKAYQQRSQEHGPIFKEKIATISTVVISDPQEYAKVIRAEGKYPIRREMEPMAHYRLKKGLGLGLVNSQGKEWYKHRTVLSTKMLKPKEVLKYLPEMDEVAEDFVHRLGSILNSRQEIPNLERELFKWAMESIGTVLFEERIGCFASPPPANTKVFINNLIGYFKCMQPLMYNVPIYKVYPTKLWRKYERYADNVIRIGQSYVNKVHSLKMANETDSEDIPKLTQENFSELSQGENPSGSCSRQSSQVKHESQSDVKNLSHGSNTCRFLSHMLSQDTLTRDEVNSTVVDLLMGAVETSSNAVIWTLYCLANNPRVQETMLKEIQTMIPDGGHVTAEILGQLPYVKAVLKETFRMFPITFATSRYLEEDLDIAGYRIPAGTHVQANLYGMGQDDELFPNPEEFTPERWMRGGNNNNFTGYSNLVWGHGARMCIGRRFAEQEIYLLLIKVIQKFQLRYDHEAVEPVLNTIMTPDRPVRLTFISRSTDAII